MTPLPANPGILVCLRVACLILLLWGHSLPPQAESRAHAATDGRTHVVRETRAGTGPATVNLSSTHVLILHALEANMPFTVAMAEAAEAALPEPGRPDRSCLQVTP